MNENLINFDERELTLRVVLNRNVYNYLDFSVASRLIGGNRLGCSLLGEDRTACAARE